MGIKKINVFPSLVTSSKSIPRNASVEVLGYRFDAVECSLKNENISCAFIPCAFLSYAVKKDKSFCEFFDKDVIKEMSKPTYRIRQLRCNCSYEENSIKFIRSL